MTKADDAYEAALKEIHRTRDEGRPALFLGGKSFQRLEEVPPELSILGYLETLDLRGTRISDLGFLSALKSLRQLDIPHTKVQDLGAVAVLSQLEELICDHTSVARLDPIASLTRLRKLVISNTAVEDLAPLGRLTALRCLRLQKTPVTDLSPIADLRNLEELDVSYSPVSDLRPILRIFENTDPARRSLALTGGGFARGSEDGLRLSEIKGASQRTEETLAYLAQLPPWPAPLPEAGPQRAAHKTAATQIDHLLKHARITRITAAQFADQIDAALIGVPATHGNELAPPLQTMAEVAGVLRNLAQTETSDDAILERAALNLRIAQLEALVERLTRELADEKALRATAEALAKQEGFAKTFTTSVATEAGKVTVWAAAAGIGGILGYFLGPASAEAQALLRVLSECGN